MCSNMSIFEVYPQIEKALIEARFFIFNVDEDLNSSRHLLEPPLDGDQQFDD